MNASPEYGLQSHSVAIACMKNVSAIKIFENELQTKNMEKMTMVDLFCKELLGVQHTVNEATTIRAGRGSSVK